MRTIEVFFDQSVGYGQYWREFICEVRYSSAMEKWLERTGSVKLSFPSRIDWSAASVSPLGVLSPVYTLQAIEWPTSKPLEYVGVLLVAGDPKKFKEGYIYSERMKALFK